jgi:hypothetical protein
VSGVRRALSAVAPSAISTTSRRPLAVPVLALAMPSPLRNG